MIDSTGRNIDYLRISLTDRCNLRCTYCIPQGFQPLMHNDIITYEELMLIVEKALELGIDKYKITGGEPFVRKGAVNFIRILKTFPGVKEVSVTTNGVLLGKYIDELKEIGIDGINISLDAADREQYMRITGFDEYENVDKAIIASCNAGIKTKINVVLLEDSLSRVIPLMKYAEDYPVHIRFIEQMPVGMGKATGVKASQVIEVIKNHYPDLIKDERRHGNGPAHYFRSERIKGTVGIIDAVSHSFCSACNRVRLTSTGRLKPCLCYSESLDLRKIIKEEPDKLKEKMQAIIFSKPEAHCFDRPETVTEAHNMSEIGG